MILQEKEDMIMISVLLDGVKKMESNSGLLEIHGVLIGVKMVILDL